MPVPLSSSAFVGSMDYTLLVSPEDCGEEIFFLMDWEWTWGFVPIRQEHSHWAISPAFVLFFLIKYLLNGLSSQLWPLYSQVLELEALLLQPPEWLSSREEKTLSSSQLIKTIYVYGLWPSPAFNEELGTYQSLYLRPFISCNYPHDFIYLMWITWHHHFTWRL